MDGMDISTGFRSLFYMVTQNESSFQHVDDVPQYKIQAYPFFISLILLEMVVGWMMTGASIVTASDGITSIMAGMVSLMPLLFVRSAELTAYMYVWDHCHLVELPWDSAWTWWLAFLAVDFGYYWVHRFSHVSSRLAPLYESDPLTHRAWLCTISRSAPLNSSNYSVSAALLCDSCSLTPRDESSGGMSALTAPPTDTLSSSHMLSLPLKCVLAQLIRDLGPLEWVLNTPSHHRVHHGRNEYCIDKNFAGVLIIWDRLF
ncbi:hypothetical protein NHX12_002182, partial [Muraenolepis orangiensis]